MKKVLLAAACLLAGAAFLAVTLAASSDVGKAPIRNLWAVDGASVYAAYCADCHGPTGHGNGRAAAWLANPAPADLSVICLRPSGFDPLTVSAKVAAGPVVGSAMPHWETILAQTYAERARRLVILHNLVDHLSSLQQVVDVVELPVEGPQIRLVAVPRLTGADGDAAYAAYCADCHGTTGRGNGHLVGRLGNHPTDLTQLHERASGFDREAITYSIASGHRMIPTADGKTWGTIFQGTYADHAHELALIQSLVDHLEELQADH